MNAHSVAPSLGGLAKQGEGKRPELRFSHFLGYGFLGEERRLRSTLHSSPQMAKYVNC